MTNRIQKDDMPEGYIKLVLSIKKEFDSSAVFIVILLLNLETFTKIGKFISPQNSKHTVHSICLIRGLKVHRLRQKYSKSKLSDYISL